MLGSRSIMTTSSAPGDTSSEDDCRSMFPMWRSPTSQSNREPSACDDDPHSRFVRQYHGELVHHLAVEWVDGERHVVVYNASAIDKAILLAWYASDPRPACLSLLYDFATGVEVDGAAIVACLDGAVCMPDGEIVATVQAYNSETKHVFPDATSFLGWFEETRLCVQGGVLDSGTFEVGVLPCPSVDRSGFERMLQEHGSPRLYSTRIVDSDWDVLIGILEDAFDLGRGLELLDSAFLKIRAKGYRLPDLMDDQDLPSQAWTSRTARKVICSIRDRRGSTEWLRVFLHMIDVELVTQ